MNLSDDTTRIVKHIIREIDQSIGTDESSPTHQFQPDSNAQGQGGPQSILRDLSTTSKAEELLEEVKMQFPVVEPYGYTTQCLNDIRNLQCPNLKLHHVFSCLKTALASEMESYYNLVARAVSEWARKYQ